MKWIKNTSTVLKTYGGQDIPVGEYYQIQAHQESAWANNSTLLVDIANGDAAVAKDDSGTTDFADVNEAVNHLKDQLPATVQLPIVSPETGRPEFIMIEPEGDGESVASHDFMDKTTWYTNSSRVTGQSLSGTGQVYNMTLTADHVVVDCDHGKITFEEDLHPDHCVKIYDNGTEVDKSNYDVDYNAGTLTFDAGYAITGPVTADFSETNDSTFTIKPSAAGKMLKINDAEIQFTKDVQMKSMKFDIWAYAPPEMGLPVGTKVPVFSRTYKSIKDIINVARQGKGYIPAIDNLTKDVMVFPFAYDRKIILRSSLGMELRIYIETHEPHGGEWGTITFYTVEENETLKV